MERLVVVGAKWKDHRINSNEYLSATAQLAKALDPEIQRRIATPFVALDIEVGNWHGMFHYKFLTAEQYAGVTGLTPSQIFERARYADVLVRWWTQIGYPFIRGKKTYFIERTVGSPNVRDTGELLQRHAIFHIWSKDPDRSNKRRATEIAWYRELDILQRWAAEYNPQDDELKRRLAYRQSLTRPSHSKRGIARCILPDHQHTGHSCIVCAFPAPWSLVSDRYQGCSPLAPIRVRRGEGPENRIGSTQVY